MYKQQSSSLYWSCIHSVVRNFHIDFFLPSRMVSDSSPGDRVSSSGLSTLVFYVMVWQWQMLANISWVTGMWHSFRFLLWCLIMLQVVWTHVKGRFFFFNFKWFQTSKSHEVFCFLDGRVGWLFEGQSAFFFLCCPFSTIGKAASSLSPGTIISQN
jgi:hypothetical protein